MKEQKMAQDNLILKIRTGSHLYGTNTEDSDDDFVGIFLEDPEYLLGLSRVDQVDLSEKSKDDSGRNTRDAKDETIYALRHFMKLAVDNNPNIVELFFANEENILFCNDVGRELLALRSAIISKNVKHRFLGFSHTQKKKMVIKMSNREAIKQAIEYLKCVEDRYDYVAEIKHHPLFSRNKKEITVADMKISAGTTCKKARKQLEDRVKKFSHREGLVSKYGFDTKFGMHIIRLIQEGITLLECGHLEFPLPERHILGRIKQGLFTLNDVLDLADGYERDIEKLYLVSKLRHSPDLDTINKFLIKTYRRTLCAYID